MIPADTRTRTLRLLVSVCLIFVTGLAGCAPAAAVATTEPAALPSPTLLEVQSVPGPVISTLPAATPTLLCSNDLGFLQDVTFPDNTVVAPGASIVKQWLVINSGTCNWSADYRLRFLQGDLMGAAPQYALYPARAGAQATLEIVFTAPSGSGTYISEWQAYDPGGLPFGDSFFVKIVVSP